MPMSWTHSNLSMLFGHKTKRQQLTLCCVLPTGTPGVRPTSALATSKSSSMNSWQWPAGPRGRGAFSLETGPRKSLCEGSLSPEPGRGLGLLQPAGRKVSPRFANGAEAQRPPPCSGLCLPLPVQSFASFRPLVGSSREEEMLFPA